MGQEGENIMVKKPRKGPGKKDEKKSVHRLIREHARKGRREARMGYDKKARKSLTRTATAT